MTLTQARLQQILTSRPFRFYPQVQSTQDIAREWLLEGAMAGAVVVADEQLTGRGRHQRPWHTPPGVALALSVILRPHRGGLKQVTMLGALSIVELLDGLGVPEVTVKWPNDVRVMGRKVSGVLPEAVWKGEQLLGVTLGMGINVRNDFTGTDLEATAISIEAALGKRVDRAVLVHQLLLRVDAWAGKLGTSALYRAWRARLETIGQSVTIDEVTGVAVDVDEAGALRVRAGDGEIHRFIAGDVLPASEER